MTIVVVAGNPKPASRTLDAGARLATALTGREPDHVVDVITLGAGLLGWGDEKVAAAVETVAAADLVVFASPTFKATYTGVLKLFLDQFATGDGLRDVVAVPLMLGAGPAHALAPDLLLKPVLVELGATSPAPGLYLHDSTYTTDTRIADYAERWSPALSAALRNEAAS
ncbi:NADPH-dependent FMN reductase [Rhodococcus rhodochrous]|uniref:NADPH-dependent FMN reductase n=1 Tax=Rhodococcus rhodochrous TaxID=1829 RepID=UPI00132EA115|nr:NAD(P)H-dependent oxidoreductase [Rhodococcus rhodochrous]QHG84337.1 NADPH-dependent oxidoreductase [Rhodococcus rhodochrous]QOH55926.1 NADPH-dependent FMN reductase [Rhodococcus rhodochrous]